MSSVWCHHRIVATMAAACAINDSNRICIRCSYVARSFTSSGCKDKRFSLSEMNETVSTGQPNDKFKLKICFILATVAVILPARTANGCWCAWMWHSFPSIRRNRAIFSFIEYILLMDFMILILIQHSRKHISWFHLKMAFKLNSVSLFGESSIIIIQIENMLQDLNECHRFDNSVVSWSRERKWEIEINVEIQIHWLA